MKRSITVAVLAAIAACGPKAPATKVAMLPGDGDANVAKPTAPTAPKGPADPWANRSDLIAPPAPKAPAKIELPPIEEMTLSNGLQVFAVKNPRLPVVSMQLAIKAGRMQEPRARLGVAEAAANMLVKGTKKRSAVELAKAIDFVGGTISADSTYEATLVSCSVLSRNFKTCLELVPEIITQSTFPDEELDKVRDGLLGGVRQRLDDAGQLASAHVQNLLWGNDHIRGWIDSERTVSAIRRDDLVAWAKAWYAPNNAMLVVTGDIDTKKLKADLERAFRGWRKSAVSPAPTFKEPGLSGSRIRLVDKPNQTQTHIRVAQFGIRHDDPRFFDSLVWNYTLGGGAFSSRLMKVVRVEGGKTYGASSSFDRNLERGSFVVQTFTRNSEAVATTKLILGEIAKMAKDGPTQTEVDSAIANIAGSYGLRFESAADVGAALVGAELHGFGREYLENYPLAVGKVDVASAAKAAGEVLDPKNYVIVMVGDAKDLEPQLQKAGWRYEKVSFTSPVTPELAQPDAPADPKALAATRQILTEAIAAKGGRKKLEALKSFRVSAEGTISAQGQSAPVKMERSVVLPDKLLIDVTIASQMRVTIGVDGKVGWQSVPGASGPQIVDFNNQDQIDQAMFELWRDSELLLLHATDPNAKVAPSKDETLNGAPHAVVKLTSPFGPELTLYIDKKTKLLSRVAFNDGGAQVEDLGDYKDVGGVKVAHARKSSGAGRVTELKLTKVEWDPAIDASVFKRPADAAKK